MEPFYEFIKEHSTKILLAIVFVVVIILTAVCFVGQDLTGMYLAVATVAAALAAVALVTHIIMK